MLPTRVVLRMRALSACTLIDGTSSGSFIWKTPNEIASLDREKYDRIFEPKTDPVLYAAKDTFTPSHERNSCLFYECYRQ